MLGILDEIAIPSRPNDETIRFRHYRGPEDLPGMAAANQAMRDADGILDTTSADDMAVQYANLTNSDLDRDLVLVERVTEPPTVAGYARVEWRDLTDGRRAFGSIVIMAPDVRSVELAGALMAWSEARIADNARHVPPRAGATTFMQTYTLGPDQTLPDALTATGWRQHGRGYEMLCEPLDDLPSVAMPDGLTLRPMVDDEPTRRAIFDAMVEAFRDHRDEPEATDADWRQFRDEPKYDPSLWVIAHDGDEVVGGAIGLIDEELIEHQGLQRGYVDGVFTRPAWRRRGLARAAVAEVLVRFRERGMTSAFLEVDGLNPNQAMGLYESLGFRIVTTSADWTKPLPEDDEKDPRP
jgi:ribosomal protein S18 acetylase RimI-like enzyme